MSLSPTKTSLIVGFEINIFVLWLFSSCAVSVEVSELDETSFELDCAAVSLFVSAA
ncbi:hypothetical protein RON38_06780 [Lactobacillus mulieris]|uniref:hypothetical protein n=1 Tax=Lactobacillus mulieris TaxID=2508708 RepID=UPI0014333076|nr:hypothetical protein [Lactobacillus mulieris]MDK6803710.1 hypothetical protein [Lactobacillus mulieris]MDK8382850.1 hypothetical protein [Lactobacillus mulieris]MDT9621192.1 hypothetical protein [Lactobacillus mulieris]NKC42059.1 hypothetical protein [Lactobacillus mulieris]